MITIAIIVLVETPAPVEPLLDHLRQLNVWSYGARTEIVLVDATRHGIGCGGASGTGVPVVRGKTGALGAAVRAALVATDATHVLIHDTHARCALPYYVRMVAALRRAGDEIVVYGSQFSGLHARSDGDAPSLGSPMMTQARRVALSVVTWLATGRYLADPGSPLKLLPRALALSLDLRTDDASFGLEISAKVLARRVKIIEVPVATLDAQVNARSFAWRRWWSDARTFWRHRHG